MRKVTFKYEDEIDGMPIGPVRLFRDGLLAKDYGWRSKAEALREAKRLKAQFEEV